MRAEAGGLRHVSAERIGGGLEADGMGELSKLLLGSRPAQALRLARDTGVLVEVIPEFAPAIGYDLGSARQPGPLDEHLFAVVQHAADAGATLAVRLARCSTTSASPAGRRATTGTRRSARGSPAESCGASATRTCSRPVSASSSPATPSSSTGRSTAGSRAASSPRTGSTSPASSSPTSEPTSPPRRSSRGSSSTWRCSPSARGGASQPAPLADLAVDGNDLIAIGYREGPALGAVLARLLDVVVDDPSANDPEALLEEARRWLP